MDLDPVLAWTARLLLAGIFAGATIAKLRAPTAFVGVVQNYRLLPAALAAPVAYALPVLEGLIAIGLLIEATRPAAALLAALLLAVFAIAIAINILRGRREIDCGCFGAELRQRLGWDLVGRNAVLIVLALAVVPASLPVRALGWLDIVTVAAGALALLVLYAAHVRLAALGAIRGGAG